MKNWIRWDFQNFVYSLIAIKQIKKRLSQISATHFAQERAPFHPRLTLKLNSKKRQNDNWMLMQLNYTNNVQLLKRAYISCMKRMPHFDSCLMWSGLFRSFLQK